MREFPIPVWVTHSGTKFQHSMDMFCLMRTATKCHEIEGDLHLVGDAQGPALVGIGLDLEFFLVERDLARGLEAIPFDMNGRPDREETGDAVQGEVALDVRVVAALPGLPHLDLVTLVFDRRILFA